MTSKWSSIWRAILYSTWFVLLYYIPKQVVRISAYVVSEMVADSLTATVFAESPVIFRYFQPNKNASVLIGCVIPDSLPEPFSPQALLDFSQSHLKQFSTNKMNWIKRIRARRLLKAQTGSKMYFYLDCDIYLC